MRAFPLEFLRQSHRQEFLAQVYLDQKLSEGRKVELPEMLRYYNDHLHDKEYDRPAQITSRKLVVEKGHHPDPADARRKADNLLARLKRGESFASSGPQGERGTERRSSPGRTDADLGQGSYAVEAVDRALNSLPLNQVSPVLEGPSSLHIVLVENRRGAGPASFEEVQDLMRNEVMYNKMHKAREVFLLEAEARRPDLDHFRRQRKRAGSDRQTMTASCEIPRSINGSGRFPLPSPLTSLTSAPLSPSHRPAVTHAERCRIVRTDRRSLSDCEPPRFRVAGCLGFRKRQDRAGLELVRVMPGVGGKQRGCRSLQPLAHPIHQLMPRSV